MGKEFRCEVEDCDFSTDNIGALGSHRKFIHGVNGRYAKQSLEQRLTQLAEEVHSSMPEITKGEIEEIIKRELQNSTFCKEFPDLCKRMERIEDLVGSHPKPNSNLLEKIWADCPECKAEWERMKREQPELFKPKGEKVAVGVSEETFAEAFPWAVED